MILGNKCDMEDKRQVSKDRGDAVSRIEFGHCRVHSFSIFCKPTFADVNLTYR